VVTACALSTTRGWIGGRKGAKEKKKGVKNSGGEKRVFVRRIRIRKHDGMGEKEKRGVQGGWEWVVGDDVDTIT